MEKVQVVNINNGEKIETYVMQKEVVKIALNGPAARKGTKDDIVIIISYATLDFKKLNI